MLPPAVRVVTAVGGLLRQVRVSGDCTCSGRGGRRVVSSRVAGASAWRAESAVAVETIGRNALRDNT